MGAKEFKEKLLLLTPKQREEVNNVISILLHNGLEDNNKI